MTAFAGAVAAWLTGALRSETPRSNTGAAPRTGATPVGRPPTPTTGAAPVRRTPSRIPASPLAASASLIGFVLLALTTATSPLAGGVISFTVASLLLSGTRLGNAVSVALLSDRVGEDQAGRWVSVNRFVGDAGLLLGPAVTGAGIDAAGFEPAFWLTAGLAATAAATIGADQWFNRGLARSRLA